MRITITFKDFIPNEPIEFILFLKKANIFNIGYLKYIETPAILCYNEQPITLKLPFYPLYIAIRKLPVHIQDNILNGEMSVLILKKNGYLFLNPHKSYFRVMI